jgi:hypothetical protein
MSHPSRSFLALVAVALSACVHTAPGAICAAPSAVEAPRSSKPDATSEGRFVVLADESSTRGQTSGRCTPALAPLDCDVFASSPHPGCNTQPWAP